MQPIVLYYVNLVLCGIVFLELLITFRKNPVLHLYSLLIITSLFVMNYFAIAGIATRIQFVFAKFMRLVYVCSTLLALVYLVQQKIPRWLNWLIILSAAAVTSMRLAYYNQINMEAMPNHVFSVGVEFYSSKPGPRYITLALGLTSIIIAYYYYRRLLLKLDMESAHYKHLSRWIISLVIPFFMLTIFGIMGNLQMFSETLSSYLFAFFSSITICSFVLRPRFLDAKLFREISGINSNKSGTTAIV